MKRFGKVLPLLALIALTAGSVAYTQNVIVLTPNTAKASGGAITADDTAVALLCKYTGTNSGGGEIAVDAGTGDITFTVNTSADTTFECPTSGGLGGVIDVSDAACNTLGEVVDVVNGVNPVATTDFKCVILDGLRSQSSNDTILTISASTADAQAGLALNFDTDVALHVSRAVVPPEARRMDFYLQDRNTLRRKPFANTRTYITWAWEDSSTCTGADTFRVVAANNYDVSSESEQIIYGPLATNTTTAVEFSNLSNSPVFSNAGAKVVARQACATTFAGGLLSVAGYQIPVTP